MGARSVPEGCVFRVTERLIGRGLWRHDEFESGGGELVVVDLDLDLLEVAILVLDGDVAGLRGLFVEELLALEAVVLAVRIRGGARSRRWRVSEIKSLNLFKFLVICEVFLKI